MNLRFDRPKRLGCTNISPAHVRRLGIEFPPAKRGQDPNTRKPTVTPAPEIVVELWTAQDELQLRACKNLKIRGAGSPPGFGPVRLR